MQGKPQPPPFKYFDKGNLAVIGRWSAVANVFGFRLSGLPAWLVWALVHLMYLVQFQSRTLVFVQWAIQDLTFNRGSRLITGMEATRRMRGPTSRAVTSDAHGRVWVSYNSPACLQHRHNIPPEVIQNMAVVETLASKARE